jgi:hypothetical protein
MLSEISPKKLTGKLTAESGRQSALVCRVQGDAPIDRVPAGWLSALPVTGACNSWQGPNADSVIHGGVCIRCLQPR